MAHSLTSSSAAPQMVSDNTHRYAVWYDNDRQIWFGKQALGSTVWQTHTLTSGPAFEELRLNLGSPPGAGYTGEFNTFPDEHNYPTIFIDSQGYLHCIANLHGHPLPYVRSTNPGDITSWTPQAAIPSEFPNNSYQNAKERPDGSLRLGLRSGPTADIAGRSRYHIWSRSSAGVWSSPTLILTGVPNEGNTTDDYTNWSPYVRYTVEWHEDNTWTEHYVWLWRTIGVSGEYDDYWPSYMQYRSATDSWHTIDGTAVTLPVAPWNNPACYTGLYHPDATVFPTLGQTTGLADNDGIYTGPHGICLDGGGHPHITSGGLTRDVHIWWDGSAWQQEKFDPILLKTGSGIYRKSVPIPYWINNKLWFLLMAGTGATPPEGLPANTRLPYVVSHDRQSLFPLASQRIDMGGGWTPVADHEAYRRRGVIEYVVPNHQDPGQVVSFGAGTRVRTS